MKKLHNNRGETFLEVLGAILIASLSLALMFGCILATDKMEKDTRALEELHYLAFTAAEAQEAAPASALMPVPVYGTVTIERVSETEEPGETPDPAESPEPGEAPEPEETVEPGETPDPEETEEPAETPTPEGDSAQQVAIKIYGSEGMYSYSFYFNSSGGD